MSSYKNYLIELPKRCKILVNKYFEIEKNNQDSFEVTLLISLAMPVFCFTNEIIKKEEINYKIVKFKTQIENTEFRESDLAKNITDETKAGTTKYLDCFNDCSPIINSNKKVLATISKIRNALSHGNIHFTTSIDNSEIINIIFCSSKSSSDKPQKEYDFIITPVKEFKILLLNWCDFLIKNDKNLDFIHTLLNAA